MLITCAHLLAQNIRGKGIRTQRGAGNSGPTVVWGSTQESTTRRTWELSSVAVGHTGLELGGTTTVRDGISWCTRGVGEYRRVRGLLYGSSFTRCSCHLRSARLSLSTLARPLPASHPAAICRSSSSDISTWQALHTCVTTHRSGSSVGERCTKAASAWKSQRGWGVAPASTHATHDTTRRNVRECRIPWQWSPEITNFPRAPS
jgi:hypothetical protein